jgi:hypothetical protein
LKPPPPDLCAVHDLASGAVQHGGDVPDPVGYRQKGALVIARRVFFVNCDESYKTYVQIMLGAAKSRDEASGILRFLKNELQSGFLKINNAAGK